MHNFTEIKNNKSGLKNLPNRNGEYLRDFSLKENLSWLSTKFQIKIGEKENYGPTPAQITL